MRIPRNSSRTAAATITVRDRAFSGPPAAFRPRLSRRPPAASRGPPAWPYDLAGTLGGRPGQGGEAVGGPGRYIHGEGCHRENKYRSSFGWRADYDCFTSCARILVWEFTRRFIPGTACAFPGSGGYRCRQAGVKEYGIAGGKEPPPVRVQLSRGGAPRSGAGGLRLRARQRAGRVVRGLPPHGGTGGAAMTALKEVAGLYSACGVRDCPVAIVAAASRLKPTRLAMPVCHSECRAAGILSAGWHRRPLPGGRAPCLGRAWSRHGDGSVAGGAGSSPEGGAAAGGAFRGRGFIRCTAHAGRRRAAARQAGAAGLAGSG